MKQTASWRAAAPGRVRAGSKFQKLLTRLVYGRRAYKSIELQIRDGDIEPDFWTLWSRIEPYTMTPPTRAYAMYQAVCYIDTNRVPGAVVECGVWRGGSAMLAALQTCGRDLYLYDTFAGMPQPSEADVTWHGKSAWPKWRKYRNGAASDWYLAAREDVAANMRSTGYPDERIRLVQGKVEDTIPGTAPDQIALLRLDTDFYESTAHELEHLYPRLVSGGVLIIDDYGHWNGARRAVDDYFASLPRAPLLTRIDYSARLAIKL